MPMMYIDLRHKSWLIIISADLPSEMCESPAKISLTMKCPKVKHKMYKANRIYRAEYEVSNLLLWWYDCRCAEVLSYAPVCDSDNVHRTQNLFIYDYDANKPIGT